MLNEAQVLAAKVSRSVITFADKIFPVLPVAIVSRNGYINVVSWYEATAAVKLALMPMP